MKLNRYQKAVLLVGLVVYVVTGIYRVPYRNRADGEEPYLIEHSTGSLISPPREKGSDWTKTINTVPYKAQQTLILVTTIGLVVLFSSSKEEDGDSPPEAQFC